MPSHHFWSLNLPNIRLHVNGKSFVMPVDVVEPDRKPSKAKYYPMTEEIKKKASEILKIIVQNSQLKIEATKYLHSTYFIWKKRTW